MNLNGRRVRDLRSDPPRLGRCVGAELDRGLRVVWDGVEGVDVLALSGDVLEHVTVEVTVAEALRVDG